MLYYYYLVLHGIAVIVFIPRALRVYGEVLICSNPYDYSVQILRDPGMLMITW